MLRAAGLSEGVGGAAISPRQRGKQKLDAGSAAGAGGRGAVAKRDGRASGPSRWVPPWSLTVPVVLLLLLRLPSLFEPHWYTDEAGYANTAWLMTHGKVLYLTVWNNKPPLLFWIYDLALAWFGPSEFGLHLFSTVAEVAALAAIWRLLRENWPGRWSWMGTLVGALLLGLPLLGGDLALPENFLIAPEAWAMVWVLGAARGSPGRRQYLQAAAAGVLVALACLVQQTAAGVAVVGVVFLAILPGRRSVVAAATMAVSGVLVIVLGMMPALLAAGFHRVFYFLVTSYGDYTTNTLPLNLASVAPRVAGGVLLVVGVLVARRRSSAFLLLWGWLAVELFIYMLPNRAYPFHLLPAAVPLVVLLGALKRPKWPTWRSWAAWAFVPLVGSALVSGAIWGSMFAGTKPQGSLYTIARSAGYYPMFVGRLVGVVGLTEYDDFYDRRVLAEQEAGRWIRAHHLQGSTAVVWSADSWAYLLTPLTPVLPAPPIYKDFDWLGGKQLLERTRRLHPRVILVTDDALTHFGPIQQLLNARYREEEVSAGGAVWILRG